jgi:hypothetical protein
MSATTPGTPTPREIRVASGALEREARHWEEESPRLSGIASTLAGMDLSRVEAGIFQIVFNSYSTLRTALEDRAREGATEFVRIGDTLRHVAEIYRDEDDNQHQQITKLH